MIAVPVHELPAIWPKVRPLLHRMADRIGTDGWIPEDVYAICAAGNASLYVNDGEWIGFAVLQVVPNYTGRRLHAWVVHCEADPEPFMERVREIARKTGCQKITFASPRKGWERRCARLGFRPTMTMYEQEV